MQKSRKAIVFGAASFAEIVYFYLQNDSEYEVHAFTVDDPDPDQTLFGLPVVPFQDVETLYPPSDFHCFVAVGYKGVNRVRAQKFAEAKRKGYTMLTYVSSKATVWTEDIGENCFLLEDNTVQPFVSIGDDVVLWSGNHIGHHSRIDDHCYITSQVVISGHCHIKGRCFLGVNATIRDGITIGEGNVIGAGALILKNTGEDEVFAMRSTPLFPKKSSELRSI